MPMNWPVGVSAGGRQMYACDAIAGVSSRARSRASASATVSCGRITIGFDFIRPPALVRA